MNDDDLARDGRPIARGFSTRAIRAASRAPRVDQRPSSVPIYQTATFVSGDAQELGDVTADPRAGYAYSRISNPTSSALGAAYAELASGEAGVAFASGMGAIHAALASQLKAGDRVVAPLAAYVGQVGEIDRDPEPCEPVDELGPRGPAFLVLRGIMTLAVRVERHARTAAALAAWLERQDGVQRVLYPGLPSHPQHDVAMRQFRPGVAGGMLAVEVAGGRQAGRAMIDALPLTELTASLGSVHTMVVHPPSTSQRQGSDAELASAGITSGLLRISVGLEDLEDIQDDLAAALAVARDATGAVEQPAVGV